jgi:glycosyltransferase involved in cell wall biosynthesis
MFCDSALVYSKMPPADVISVVITTYNRSESLTQVLRAMAEQDDREFELVIADDGSNEAHQAAINAALCTLGLRATHVWHPDIGFTASRARNRGVGASTGAYIIFLDGDCVPERDFIRQHRRLREADFFLNGSRVMLSQRLTRRAEDDNLLLSGRSALFWLRAFACGDASKISGLLRLPDFSARKRQGFVWRGIRSCNMGVWRAHFESINGFDESFVGWGHEDADFVLRLHNLGVGRKNGQCATEVYHLWHAQSSRQQESENARRVEDRMTTGQICSTIGYRESLGGADVVIKRLG